MATSLAAGRVCLGGDWLAGFSAMAPDLPPSNGSFSARFLDPGTHRHGPAGSVGTQDQPSLGVGLHYRICVAESAARSGQNAATANLRAESIVLAERHFHCGSAAGVVGLLAGGPICVLGSVYDREYAGLGDYPEFPL